MGALNGLAAVAVIAFVVFLLYQLLFREFRLHVVAGHLALRLGYWAVVIVFAGAAFQGGYAWISVALLLGGYMLGNALDEKF